MLRMSVVGWDIGGVHLKAARAEERRVVAAVQIAAPLRYGLDALVQAFAEAKSRVGTPRLHVITMTGELADTFVSRRDGVSQLADLAARELADAPVRLYAGPAGFVAPQEAANHATRIASANWHASAAFLAQRCGTALFMDMGSTTTDIVPARDGTIVARGYTDAERLAAGELVYTGLVRGFVMAAADRAPFAGAWTPLVNENFANMADVHRILGTLPQGADRMATADGREKSIEGSRARLARMVGRDAGDADGCAWTALARWFGEAQVRAVTDAAMLVLSQARLPGDAPVVAAGTGSAVIEEVARRLDRPTLRFESLIEAAPELASAVSCCAPAAALALLASATMKRLENGAAPT
jgi:(4-(4-[2-(gamma-L-glutamylamino)ethyl]phenoxymethyl)furan-2-yl)methanamine synthase